MFGASIRSWVLAAAVLLCTTTGVRAADGEAPAGASIRYVAAITNPFFNETPYITTEVRPVYMYTRIPESFSVADGGSVHTTALQIRYAINDRIDLAADRLADRGRRRDVQGRLKPQRTHRVSLDVMQRCHVTNFRLH